VSAGVYGWPLEDAARIAIEAIRSTDTHLERATFVLFNDAAFAAFEAALAAATKEEQPS